jgi:hypothetical protein
MEPSALRAVLVVEESLAVWQKLNIAAFAVSGVAHTWPDLVGDPYRDADGHEYLPMFGLPVVVLSGRSEQVLRAFRRAAERGLRTTIYTRELFTTGNDHDNRAAVAAVPFDQLDVVGFAAAGAKRAIDKATDGLRMHE